MVRRIVCIVFASQQQANLAPEQLVQRSRPCVGDTGAPHDADVIQGTGESSGDRARDLALASTTCDTFQSEAEFVPIEILFSVTNPHLGPDICRLDAHWKKRCRQGGS
mmetsp:Transcript_34371/g.91978  ORF Transcript_34371/g.91978 Transcript_34371/m.91978 type:complete len:108 (+) Transcript_34371:740-1063(+)